MNIQQQHISKLDASMIRCGVGFVFKYTFEGSVNCQKLQMSTIRVLSSIPRLQEAMKLKGQYEGEWVTHKRSTLSWFEHRVSSFETALEQCYQNLARQGNSTAAPMQLTLVNHDCKANQFALLQSGMHSYVDGTSATAIFNLIIKHYNATLLGDVTTCQKIESDLKKTTSPVPDEIFSLWNGKKRSLIKLSRWEHVKNLFHLLSYKINDERQYSSSFEALPKLLQNFKPETSKPKKAQFNLTEFINGSQKVLPSVSPNNMICALIAKVMYEINLKHRKYKAPKELSFRVMVDILNAGLRKQILGNYIAYLPVTVDGSMPIDEIATHVNKQIYTAKVTKKDISMYKLLEFALGSGMANKTNDPVSYIISNVSNPLINFNSNLMKGACCQKFEAYSNSLPIDFKGAQLNNRPAICFHLNANKQLFVSFFNTLTDPNIQTQFGATMDRVLKTSVQTFK
jgi:hypothetical protein